MPSPTVYYNKLLNIMFTGSKKARGIKSDESKFDPEGSFQGQATEKYDWSRRLLPIPGAANRHLGT